MKQNFGLTPRMAEVREKPFQGVSLTGCEES